MPIGGPAGGLGWQRIDITTTVRKWYAQVAAAHQHHHQHQQSASHSIEPPRLQLLVDCSGCGDRVVLHLFGGRGAQPPAAATAGSASASSSVDPHRPFLVVFTDPSAAAAAAAARRVRRRAVDCSGAAPRECCKEKFYVDFRELGWDDWIIAPHGYYANYCRGDCSGPRTPDRFQSYHSHVLEEYRKMDRLSGLQPCCAPLKFSSMSLIYFEENQKIVKRDLPKMVVEECGCP